jgi:hypothetical protein
MKHLSPLLSSFALGLAVALCAVPAEAAPAKKKPAVSKTAKKKAAKPKVAPGAITAGHEASPGMKAAAAALALAAAGDASATQAAQALKLAGNPPRAAADILNTAPPEAWREPDPSHLVLMEFKLATQPEPAQVLMELAPQFAPQHAANIRALVRGGYFNGLSVLRVQDNFVTQWGDPNEGPTAKALPAEAQAKLPAEFDVALAGLPLHALAENDGWAPLSGFVDGFAVAADPAVGRPGTGLAGALLWRGGRGARQRDRLQQRQLAVRHRRPAGTFAGPQHHRGGPGAQGHRAPGRAAARQRQYGLLWGC